MQTLLQDLRYGTRMLLKTPGFTVIAILTLALGIGANTALFSLINSVLLRPPDYPQPAEIVRLHTGNASRGWTQSQVSLPDFRDWQAQQQAFAALAAFTRRSANLAGSEQPERVEFALATADLFAVLGTEPLLGRVFTFEEDQPGRGDVVVLSQRFWRRAFGSDPAILNRRLMLNGEPCTVVGVMPAQMQFPDAEVELWKPLAMKRDEAGDRSGRWLEVVGRLKPGVPLAQGQAEMQTISARLAQRYPDSNTGWTVSLTPLQEDQVGDSKLALLLLWGAVGLVLLIACANVAGLLLARAAGRAKEIALRRALGAGQGRIVRQLLTESLLLALLGGVAGLLLAGWGIEWLPKLDPNGLASQLELDRWVLAYALGLSVLTGVLFGLLPAFKVARADLQTALKEGGQSAGAASQRARQWLVVGEVALTLTLLVGAGLLLRSFMTLLRVDPGFSPQQLLTMRIAPPQIQQQPGDKEFDFFERLQRERQTMAGFYRNLTERITALPGVQAAGVINRLPLTGTDWTVGFNLEGRPALSRAQQPTAFGRIVDAGLLRALGVPLQAGRWLAETDRENAPAVAVINQTMAQRLWPNESPLGKRLRFGEEPAIFAWVTVVGVVGDVHFNTLESPMNSTIYLPFSQAVFGHFGDWGMSLVVRASADPLALIGPLREQVQALDKTLPVYQVRTMDQVLGQTVTQRRTSMLLLALFAGLALLLALIGIYGVTAYAVSQRTRELGVRVALGAQPQHILRLVVGQGMRLALCGAGLGLGAAAALTRFLSSLLFGVSATDPWTYLGMVLLLLGVAWLACWIPARRAAGVDPLVALRCE